MSPSKNYNNDDNTGNGGGEFDSQYVDHHQDATATDRLEDAKELKFRNFY